jgi:hypothetical protein
MTHESRSDQLQDTTNAVVPDTTRNHLDSHLLFSNCIYFVSILALARRLISLLYSTLTAGYPTLFANTRTPATYCALHLDTSRSLRFSSGPLSALGIKSQQGRP